jgi:hypothetical protein
MVGWNLSCQYNQEQLWVQFNEHEVQSGHGLGPWSAAFSVVYSFDPGLSKSAKVDAPAQLVWILHAASFAFGCSGYRVFEAPFFNDPNGPVLHSADVPLDTWFHPWDLRGVLWRLQVASIRNVTGP